MLTAEQATVKTEELTKQFIAINSPSPSPNPNSNSNSKNYYTPKFSVVSTSDYHRIAIIGGPGSGKTTAIKTFPNRVWADFDHKLPKDEAITLPFWNSEFCNSLLTIKSKPGGIINRRDAFKYWLMENHPKFHEEQTFILDSWTMLMNAFEVKTKAEDDLLDLNDKSNKYFIHAARLRYCRELFDCFRAMKCTVVITLHESPDRDDTGELNGKVQPLMDGKFKDQLLGQFTDVWRQRSNIYETDERGVIRRDPKTNQRIIKRVNHNGNSNWVWFWQLLGDSEFDTNCNSNLGEKVRKYNKYLVPADYNEILKIYQLP